MQQSWAIKNFLPISYVLCINDMGNTALAAFYGRKVAHKADVIIDVDVNKTAGGLA